MNQRSCYNPKGDKKERESQVVITQTRFNITSAPTGAAGQIIQEKSIAVNARRAYGYNIQRN